MYGYSPYTYKINTGMAWGFRQFNNAVKMANILSMNYKVCLTLGKNTLSQMEDYVLAAVQAGAKEINFGMPAPVGRAIEGPDNKQNYIFSKEDLRFVYFKMRELKMKYKEKINVVVWQHSALYKSKKAASFAQCDGCLDCGGGWYSIVLSEKGLVRPCELLPEAIFSYGDISALYRIAEEGYFFAPELNEMINKFNTSILQENLELSQICFALDKLNTAAGGERDEK